MSGVRKESRNDSVAGSSTMMEPTMMEEGEEYFNTEEPSAEWTEPTACSQLCRMCATENEYLIPIFDGEGVEHQLGMKIEKHLPIRVHVDDTLPLQVCYQCASTLIAWHDLVVGCIEAEKKLRQLQHQGEPQEEDIEDVKTCDTAMFYEDPTGTEPANDPIDTEPSTSASTHVQIRLPPKKTVPKANPKLKMVIVKTPTPATVTAPTARMVTPKTEGALDTTERLAAAHSGAGANSSQLTIIVQCVCAHCGLTFSFTNELASHLAVEHDVSIYHCDVCNELVQGPKQKFVEHSRQHQHAGAQARPSFPCGDCGKEFPRKCDVLRHMRVHEAASARVSHACAVCLASFADESELAEHARTHAAGSGSEVDGFPCPLCGKVLSRKHDLKRHIFYSHKADWPGMRVSKPTAKLKELQSHCPLCSRVFSRKFDMRRHLRKRHPEHPGHAPAMEIGDAHELLDQLFSPGTARPGVGRAKAKEKDSPCFVCHRLFARKWDMIRHLTKVHPEFEATGSEGRAGPEDGDGKLLQEADRTFFRRAKQKANENVPCPVCQHAFSRKYDMIRHLKVHPEFEGTSPLSAERLASDREVDASRVVSPAGQTHYRCRQCGVSVTQRYAFVRHLRVHSGERPFTCEVCGGLASSPARGLRSWCVACAPTAASRFPSPGN